MRAKWGKGLHTHKRQQSWSFTPIQREARAQRTRQREKRRGPWPAKEKRPLRQRGGLKAGDKEELRAPPKKEMRQQVSGAEGRDIETGGGWWKKEKRLPRTTGWGWGPQAMNSVQESTCHPLLGKGPWPTEMFTVEWGAGISPALPSGATQERAIKRGDPGKEVTDGFCLGLPMVTCDHTREKQTVEISG